MRIYNKANTHQIRVTLYICFSGVNPLQDSFNVVKIEDLHPRPRMHAITRQSVYNVNIFRKRCRKMIWNLVTNNIRIRACDIEVYSSNI